VTTVIEEASSKKVGALNTLIARPPSLIRSINPAAVFAGLKTEVLAQVGRWTLWTPVAFGAGAATYFGLKQEPIFWIAFWGPAAVAVALLVACRWTPRRDLMIACTLAAFALSGFAIAELKAKLVAAPIIPAGYGVGKVEGWVVDVSSPSKEKGRLLIAPAYISHLRRDELPALIRIAVAPEAVVGPGEAVRLTALLDPPPGPAAPGAFDFARDAWFERIGGVGLALKQPTLTDLPPPPASIRLAQTVNRLRWRLARQLVSDSRAEVGPAGEGAAGLAAAVTTSHEGWLPAEAATTFAALASHICWLSPVCTRRPCAALFSPPFVSGSPHGPGWPCARREKRSPPRAR